MEIRPRFMLNRILLANYQNGNTKKAFTLNLTRPCQLAASEDLDALIDYARSVEVLAPLFIEDRNNGETVFKLDK